MAFRTRWTRPHSRRLISVRAVALAAALATVLPAAACASAPASSGASTTADAQSTGSPAITAAQARQVFDRYVAAATKTAAPHSASAALSLLTGVEHAVVATTIAPGFAPYAYGSPTFYLPEASGYPRFFAASVTRTLQGTKPAGHGTARLGGASVPVDGPALMLFTQAGQGAPWLLASISQLPSGVTIPPLARDGSGYIPIVTPTAAALLTQPDYVGALQAAVVDDGPASAATRAVANGPLTTGMYQGALSHVDGITAPHGDVYQWELEGSSLPQFALRTADGGALVFYAMTLNTSVAVPDYVNKANPIRSGPPIQVPLDVQELLPKGQPSPLVQLQSEQTLSFAAIDPVAGSAKVQVVAIGGGLTSASAS